jgi:hypothetical protein
MPTKNDGQQHRRANEIAGSKSSEKRCVADGDQQGADRQVKNGGQRCLGNLSF